MNLTALKISAAITQLQESYRHQSPKPSLQDVQELCAIAEHILRRIACSDALYHNLDHTILVTLTGQIMLQGKQCLEGNVTSEAWLHFIISLLCHDIGYLKGICSQDQVEQALYMTAIAGDMIYLPPGSTDASLAPYHIDRGKLYVEETFQEHPDIDLKRIKQMIELTRFPVPSEKPYRDTRSYSGLARAADLIGQLSDPYYLPKIPALFNELQETGVAKQLGYRHPGDIRERYPTFYQYEVYPHIQDGLHYLEATFQGKQIIDQLYTNLRNARNTLVSHLA